MTSRLQPLARPFTLAEVAQPPLRDWVHLRDAAQTLQIAPETSAREEGETRYRIGLVLGGREGVLTMRVSELDWRLQGLIRAYDRQAALWEAYAHEALRESLVSGSPWRAGLRHWMEQTRIQVLEILSDRPVPHFPSPGERRAQFSDACAHVRRGRSITRAGRERAVLEGCKLHLNGPGTSDEDAYFFAAGLNAALTLAAEEYRRVTDAVWDALGRRHRWEVWKVRRPEEPACSIVPQIMDE